MDGSGVSHAESCVKMIVLLFIQMKSSDLMNNLSLSQVHCASSPFYSQLWDLVKFYTLISAFWDLLVAYIYKNNLTI